MKLVSASKKNQVVNEKTSKPNPKAGVYLQTLISNLFSFILILPIRLYKIVLSPWLGNSCRFYPTCSNYAIESLKKHGPIKGLALTAWRILRCNQWGGHGIDTVPEKFQLKKFKSVENYEKT